jgi:ATP-dependent helicase/nuclease subunit A
VRRLADEDAGEADADVVEQGDPHAVRLLTVHSAKGLEFPVVIVPECGATPRTSLEGVLLDQDLGLALRVRGAGWRRWGTHGLEVRARRTQRDAAQARRLLYVAATRARDLLIFAGRTLPRGETWRSLIDRALPDCADLLRVLPDGDTGQLEPARAVATAGETAPDLLRAAASWSRPSDGGAQPGVSPAPASIRAGALDRARELIARVERHSSSENGGTVVAAVTQLADASACARRYQLLHELGLAERPQVVAGAGAGATERGTLAHRLLELASFESMSKDGRRAELRRLLELEGEDPDAPGNPEVIAAVTAFLESPLARRMAQAPSGQVLRELPFTLRLDPPADRPASTAVVVRGQLDALLVDGSEATVVDYKLSRAAAPGRYEFQLDAYALAADALTRSTVPVRSGLVFLRSPGSSFVAREPPTKAALEAIRQRLLDAGAAVASGRRTGVWPKVDSARCRELECGFLRRCHPDEATRAAAAETSADRTADIPSDGGRGPKEVTI